MSIRILGTGSYIPEKVMTNADFEKFLDTSDEWIVKRTGIHRRHIADGMLNAEMAQIAAERALEMAGVSVSELGAIICASVTNELQVPSIACHLVRSMGASCPAFDVNAACTGFMYALKTAAGLILQEPKPVLVVGTETLSRLMDYTDRTTCILFADGAGAAVVGPGENLKYFKLYAIPDTDHSLEIPGLNNGLEKGQPEYSFVKMDGKAIYVFATREVPRIVQEALDTLGWAPEEVDRMVAHQANIRILESASKRLNIPMEKFYSNIDEVGNTSSASIPILMDEMNRKGMFKSGDKVILVGFGGGLTLACAAFEW